MKLLKRDDRLLFLIGWPSIGWQDGAHNGKATQEIRSKGNVRRDLTSRANA